jgi:two-component system, cell cycle sensor histidine kinase PleC
MEKHDKIRTESGTPEANLSDLSPNLEARDLAELKDEILAGFAEVSSNWFWEMDENLRFSWFSKNIEKYMGVPREWNYGKTRAELGVPDSSQQEWEEHLETLREHKPFKDFVYRWASPQGHIWLSVSGKPVFGPEGRFTGYIGTGHDVTALMLMRREAERNAELIEQAVDGMSELFVLCDPEGRIVMFNQKFREVNAAVIDRVRLGMKFEDFVRLVISDGLAPEAIGREEEYFNERMHYHNNPGGSFITRRDRDRWLLVRDQRTRNGGTIIVSADISEQVEAESQLRDAVEQVQFANRAKTEFLANMSHELRTPLNAIIGFSDILSSELFGPMGNERYVEYSGNINKAGLHLLELIGDILDVSKIEAGKINLDEEEVEIASLLDDCRMIVQPRAFESFVRLEINVAETVTPILADPMRIKQILINILANAIKFSKSGGRVSISVTGGGDRPTRITVEDEGIGISERDLPMVVEPFFQVLDAALGKREGTGLGLTLAKAFAENHEGELLIDSELGVGTRVCLALPASRNLV